MTAAGRLRPHPQAKGKHGRSTSDGLHICRSALAGSGNGEFALEASRSWSHPGRIDLLLTDIEIHRMNGLQLYKNIRAERPESRH